MAQDEVRRPGRWGKGLLGARRRRLPEPDHGALHLLTSFQRALGTLVAVLAVLAARAADLLPEPGAGPAVAGAVLRRLLLLLALLGLGGRRGRRRRRRQHGQGVQRRRDEAREGGHE